MTSSNARSLNTSSTLNESSSTALLQNSPVIQSSISHRLSDISARTSHRHPQPNTAQTKRLLFPPKPSPACIRFPSLSWPCRAHLQPWLHLLLSLHTVNPPWPRLPLISSAISHHAPGGDQSVYLRHLQASGFILCN